MGHTINSINYIEVYEENGSELNTIASKKPSVIIREHWNRRELITINMGDITYSVLANDLIAAIQNAQNAHTY